MQEGLLGASSRSERRQRASAFLLLAALLGLILTAAAWLASSDSFGEGLRGSSSGAGVRGDRSWWAVWQHDVLHYTVRGSLADLAVLCGLRAILVAGLGAVGACSPPHGLTRRWQIIGWAACAACTAATIAKLAAPALMAGGGTVTDVNRSVLGWCVVGLAFGWPLLEAALIANAAAAGHELIGSAPDSSWRRAVDRATAAESRHHTHAHRIRDTSRNSSQSSRGGAGSSSVEIRTLPSGERAFVRRDSANATRLRLRLWRRVRLRHGGGGGVD